MSSSFDDIREQEEDIFEDLSSYDLPSLDVSNGEPYSFVESAQVVDGSAKNQARRQLALSEDSPFCNVGHVYETSELRRLKEEKTARLREETDEIKRQLDIVKNRLNELKANSTPKFGLYGDGRQQPAEPKRGAAGIKRSDATTPAGPHRVHDLINQPRSKAPIASARLSKQSEPKFRPLTGKADCPNCNCDRRSSVCDRCISIAITKPIIRRGKLSSSQNSLNEPKNNVIHHDDRPIRPAKERLVNDTGQIEFDSSIVPNKIYTISKSLNDKRTKLAQAIDELHLTMDQVKEKGNRLEQERKLVQLYKDQWKFGPTIGGPIASSRDRLNTDKRQQQQHQQRRTYESRLDPNLTRDSKSLMGFQHVGAAMRLRNYHDTKDNTMKKRPMTDRMRPIMHSRSKSFESLKLSGGKNPIMDTGRGDQAQRFAPAHKSSSELAINKAAKNDDDDDDDDDANDELEEVAEDLEEEIHDTGDDPNRQPSRVSPPEEVAVESGMMDNNKRSAETVQRMTWIPVFGETEVKTIKRDLPKRKIQIITPDSQADNHQSHINRKPLPRSKSGLKSVLSQNSNRQVAKNKCNNPKTINNSSGSDCNGRIIAEAQRKLKAYSNLLEQEQRDASTKNQLIVTRSAVKPTPKPRLARGVSPSKAINNHQEQVQSNQSNVQKSSIGASIETSKEIARIEEMVNEQQRLLAKLVQVNERPLVSPVTVSCSSPCCYHRASPSSKTSGGSAPHRLVSNPSNNKSLINILRDRLNKSKMRLARILEEEREKHQKLKQKVDSSLRKQSDLENENELLKQSLSKCIDTCLKDISNTFESLSETLDDSVNGLGNFKHLLEDGDRLSTGQTDGVGLTNAAQLIADNRHLKQMRGHIETIERQRKAIFDELAKEKQRSSQFEAQLRESQHELRQLIETKQRLESRLELVSDEQSDPPPTSSSDQQVNQQNKSAIESDQSATNKQSTLNNLSSQTETTDKSDMDDTYNSVDVYRRYIQSMSPDLESLKRDRMVILSEFDNIKKILSDIDK